MKSTLISIGIGLLILIVYLSGFFDLFVLKYSLLVSIMLVIVVILIGFKVLGKPWGKGNKK